MPDPHSTGCPPHHPGWERHREAQLRRLAQLPLTEKLAWLEEAQRLVEHLQNSPGEYDSPPALSDEMGAVPLVTASSDRTP